MITFLIRFFCKEHLRYSFSVLFLVNGQNDTDIFNFCATTWLSCDELESWNFSFSILVMKSLYTIDSTLNIHFKYLLSNVK